MKLSLLVDQFTYEITFDLEDQVYIAKSAELPSVKAHGDTHERALKEVKKANKLALEDMFENGEELPRPLALNKYSGKVHVRMGPDLHREFAKDAALNGMSMNQLILNKLAK
ncbi:toxin-antitoxin system HicB family antitoxin [bacterium]|nr:toxin-antitoxin system HicB family antitoxin [bacterium]